MNEAADTPRYKDPIADRTNMDRLRAMTDAEIERAVREDPDSFVPDESWMKYARVVLPKDKQA